MTTCGVGNTVWEGQFPIGRGIRGRATKIADASAIVIGEKLSAETRGNRWKMMGEKGRDIFQNRTTRHVGRRVNWLPGGPGGI